MTDRAGNTTREGWNATVDFTRPSSEPGKLGLEQYFQYDSLDTGLAGSHANLATGNLVWHKVPMVNPGRGLSSVLNLTYNSYDYPLTGDIPLDSRFLALDYDEAGLGFSLGLSGVTRVNEPLGGVLIPNVFGADADPGEAGTQPGAITMTDPDGTRHTFTADESNKSDGGGCIDGLATRYDAPAGVNLELRRYGCPGTDAARLVNEITKSIDVNDVEDPLFIQDFLELDLSGQNPEIWPGQGDEGPMTLADLVAIPGLRDDPDASGNTDGFEDLYALEQEDLWAITRPDGVTYYYNGFGFPTKTVDRDANELRYVYEKVNPLGEDCALGQASGTEPPIVPGVCEPRLVEVIDPAGVDHQDPNQEGNEAPERTVTLDYVSLEDFQDPVPGEISLDSLDQAITDLGGLAGPSAADINRLGKVSSITDHACHLLELDYDADGRLRSLTEAAESEPGRSTGCEGTNQPGPGEPEGEDVRRVTDFAYDDPADPQNPLADPLAHPQLSSVSEPHPG